MSIGGAPTVWLGLINSLVPDILKLAIASWEELPSPSGDAKEDVVTLALCRKLRQNRTARSLPFQVDIQQVELNPAPGESLGRLDIAFRPLVPREDIYFCIECKRLNVVKDGRVRGYASEYVTLGMLRFVTGQYSHAVQHGAMLGYVLDGKVTRAIAGVARNLRKQHVTLRMAAPGAFHESSILPDEPHVKETHHQRANEKHTFLLHHLFLPCVSRPSSGQRATA